MRIMYFEHSTKTIFLFFSFVVSYYYGWMNWIQNRDEMRNVRTYVFAIYVCVLFVMCTYYAGIYLYSGAPTNQPPSSSFSFYGPQFQPFFLCFTTTFFFAAMPKNKWQKGEKELSFRRKEGNAHA